MPPDLKLCSKCGALKMRAHFGAHKGGRDGLRASCKQCDVASAMAYRAENPQVKVRADARYRRKNRRTLAEKERIRHQLFSADDKKRHRENGYKWAIDNRDKRTGIEIRRNAAMRMGIPYALLPEAFVEAKVAHIKLARIIRVLKKGYTP